MKFVLALFSSLLISSPSFAQVGHCTVRGSAGNVDACNGKLFGRWVNLQTGGERDNIEFKACAEIALDFFENYRKKPGECDYEVALKKVKFTWESGSKKLKGSFKK